MADMEFPLPEDRVRVAAASRLSSIPSGLEVIGSEGDAWVERVPISVPRYVDGTDLGEFDTIRVNYLNNENEQDCYLVASWVTTDTEIVFWWEVGPTACGADGITQVSVQVILHDDDGVGVLKDFNSSIAKFTVRPSVRINEETVAAYSDAVSALILEWNSDVSTTVAAAQDATAAANAAAVAANSIVDAVEATHDAAYQEAETARQELYVAAEAGRDAASENQFTIRDGAYCITYEEE